MICVEYDLKSTDCQVLQALNMAENETKKPRENSRGQCFKTNPESSPRTDCLNRTNSSAGTTINACIGIDGVRCSLADCFHRTFGSACSAGNAGIRNTVSHYYAPLWVFKQ